MSLNKATINDSWVLNPDGTLGFTCSPFTGCLKRCDWCFAWTLANSRLLARYVAHDNNSEICYGPEINDMTGYRGNAEYDAFYPRYWPDKLKELDRFLARQEKPVGVFLNIMGDGFGPWLNPRWIEAQMEVIRRHPGHRIYLLTHQPKELPAWSPFPDNCHVGFTANNGHEFIDGLNAILHIEAKVIFVSIEPMIYWDIPVDILVGDLKGQQVDWLIIGAMTGSCKKIMAMHQRFPELTPMRWLKHWTLQPKVEWVKTVIDAADESDIPVFMKPNLIPLVPPFGNDLFPPTIRVRQEMPGGARLQV